MKLSLNGSWRLTFFPETPQAPSDPDGIARGGYPEIDAVVPGEAPLDLMRAGLEPDPLWGENLYRYRKYEFYRWMYRRSFDAPEGAERLNLRFEGVNTVAEVFVNGVSAGRCDNMLIPPRLRRDGARAPGRGERPRRGDLLRRERGAAIRLPRQRLLQRAHRRAHLGFPDP